MVQKVIELEIKKVLPDKKNVVVRLQTDIAFKCPSNQIANV